MLFIADPTFKDNVAIFVMLVLLYNLSCALQDISRLIVEEILKIASISGYTAVIFNKSV